MHPETELLILKSDYADKCRECESLREQLEDAKNLLNRCKGMIERYEKLADSLATLARVPLSIPTNPKPYPHGDPS